MTMQDDPDFSSPAALWEALRHYIQTAFTLFGGPECVALLGFITRREHADIVSWLRPLEIALRKLIYLQAVTAPAPPTRASPPRAKTKRLRRFLAADPERPETWRVTFRVGPPAPSRHAIGAKAAANRMSLLNAWPIAERFEALIRAFNNPAPLVRRMARLIRRAPALFAALLTFKPSAKRDPCDFLLEAITGALPPAADTS